MNTTRTSRLPAGTGHLTPSSARYALVAVLLAVITAVAGGCTGQARSYFNQAEKEWLAEHYHESAKLFERVLSDYPGTSYAREAMYRLGEINYLNLNDYKTAIMYFSRVIELDDGSAEMHARALKATESIAEMYAGPLRDYNNAIIFYQRVITSFSDIAPADQFQYKIAQSYYRKGDYAQALTEYETMLEKYPDSQLKPDVYFQIANCEFIMGNCEKAQKQYAQLLEKFPDNKYKPDILFSMGFCLEEQEKFADALKIFESIRESYHNPKMVENKIESIRKLMTQRKR